MGFSAAVKDLGHQIAAALIETLLKPLDLHDDHTVIIAFLLLAEASVLLLSGPLVRGPLLFLFIDVQAEVVDGTAEWGIKCQGC